MRRFKLIACEILFRELCYCAARCEAVVDAEFVPKALHDVGAVKMSARLQAEIDAVDPARYDAILLGFGLCSNGIAGLRAPIPMVVPRAHDCITLLIGSRGKYEAYFYSHPGTYFKSTGWIERNGDGITNPESIPSQLGMDRSYQEYVRKYGEDNARYLMETLGDGLKQYRRLAYIDTGVGDIERYAEQTRQEAVQRGWEYELLEGGTDLLARLLNGAWDPADFLFVAPGRSIRPVYSGEIVGIEEQHEP